MVRSPFIKIIIQVLERILYGEQAVLLNKVSSRKRCLLDLKYKAR